MDLARKTSTKKDIASQSLTTCMHCAPEMKHQLVGINYKVDIWCLGIILYELYKNSHPFEADSPKEVINKINNGIEEAKIGDTAIDKIILG